MTILLQIVFYYKIDTHDISGEHTMRISTKLIELNSGFQKYLSLIGGTI
jgi:hypothetical protein